MVDYTLAPDGKPFQARSHAFLEWFTSAKATRVSPKLDIADLRASCAGRGVVANADIAEDEELFAVPRSLILDGTNSDLQQHINQSLKPFGTWNALIVVIIYEYLRKDASPWFPYFEVLPTTFDTLMFWGPTELAELQGSAVVNKIGKSEAEETWKTTIIPFMRSRPSLFPVFPAEADSPFVQLAHMAGSLIMAYAFDLDQEDDDEDEANADENGFVEDNEDEPAKGMVPFADLLNADADRNNARLFHEDHFLIMKATRAIQDGDEIFNDYGPLPRSDLVRMYGYVTDNYAQYDVLEISSQLFHNTARALRKKYKGAKKDLPDLKDLEFVEDGYAIFRPAMNMTLDEAIPLELHMLITAVSMEKDDTRKQYFTFAEADLLNTVLRNRLADYQTTAKEDEHALELLNSGRADLPNDMSINRVRMAVQVRKGEKEILQQLSHLAQERITGGTNGKRKHDAGDTKSNKAQKNAPKK